MFNFIFDLLLNFFVLQLFVSLKLLSLSEVREIIEMYDLDSGENGQLRYFLEQIKKRREALQQQRYDIELTLGELDSIESECKHRLSALS